MNDLQCLLWRKIPGRDNENKKERKWETVRVDFRTCSAVSLGVLLLPGALKLFKYSTESFQPSFTFKFS